MSVELFSPPTELRGCDHAGCTARAIVVIATKMQGRTVNLENYCLGHFLEWSALLETWDLVHHPEDVPPPSDYSITSYLHKSAGSTAGN